MDTKFTACEGNVDLLYDMIMKGYDVNLVDRYGYNALVSAVKNNQVEATQFLLEQGANVNDSDAEGWTPLHEAALSGSDDLVMILIDWGADKDIRNKDGLRPLGVSIFHGHASIAYKLCEGYTSERGFF